MSSYARTKVWRWLGVVLRGGLMTVGTVLTFAAMLVVAIVLHLNMPRMRRLLAHEINGILASSLMGKVTIDKLGIITPFGVSDVYVSVASPEGIPVASADDIDVAINIADVVKSALRTKEDFRIVIQELTVHATNVSLDANDQGDMYLTRALQARETGAPKNVEGRKLFISFYSVELDRARVHRAQESAEPLEAVVTDLRTSIFVEPAKTTVDLTRANLALDGLPKQLAVNGGIRAKLVTPSPHGDGVWLNVDFGGDVSGIPTTLVAFVDGKKIEASAVVKRIAGERIRAAVAEAPIYDPVDVRVDARGTLPNLAVNVNGGVGKGTLDVQSNLVLEDVVRVNATAHVRHIDARSFEPTLMRTDFGADLMVEGSLPPNQKPSGEVRLDTVRASTIDGTELPPIAIVATAAGETAHAKISVVERGMPTEIEADLDRNIVTFSVRSTIRDLANVPRLKTLMQTPVPQGHVEIDASGSYWIKTKQLDVASTVTARNIHSGQVDVGGIQIGARATGSISNLSVKTHVNAQNVKAGEIDLDRVDVDARVDPSAGIVISDAVVGLERAGVRVRTSANKIRVNGDHITVEQGRVEGLGSPLYVELSRSSAMTRVRAKSSGIEIERIGKIVRMEKDLRSGLVAIDADMTLRKSDANGRVSVRASDLSAFTVNKGKVDLLASIQGPKVRLDLDAQLGEAGSFKIATEEARLDGDPMNPATWKAARGRIEINSAIDLCKLSTSLSADSIPFNELCGKLEAHGHIARLSTDPWPDVDIALRTLGLVVSGKSDVEQKVGDTQISTMPWRVSGVDVEATVKLDAITGDAVVASQLVDHIGVIVSVDAKSRLMDAVVRPAISMRDRLLALKLDAHVAMPERKLESLPGMLGLHDVPGSASFDVDFKGSLGAPRLEVSAHLVDAHPAAASTDLHALYDGSRADVKLHSTAKAGGSLDVTAEALADSNALLNGRKNPQGEPPWTASAKVNMASFPLESLSDLIGPRVRGKVNLEAELKDLHKDATLKVRGKVVDPRIARVKYRDAVIEVDAGNGAFSARVRLDQAETRNGAGFAEVTAKSAITWGPAIAPALDPSAAVEARLSAKAFRASAILPFVQGALDDLDGLIDADASVSIQGEKKNVSGAIKFRDGMLHAPVLGDDLRGIRFDVTAAPDGTVKMENFVAHGVEGEVEGNAQVQLDGLAWKNAKAKFSIDQTTAMNVALQGEPLGKIWGQVEVAAANNAAAKKIALNVNVPRLNLKLPPGSRNDLQDLEEQRSDIRVGQYISPARFVLLPRNANDAKTEAVKQGDQSELALDVKLGEITVVRGNNVNVLLTGDPRVVVTGKETRVTGQIRVIEGTLDVQGKQFTIQRGVVTFAGRDPSNPTVSATAEWTASDKTKVYADFLGTVNNGKLTMRSDPPLPQSEVFALILFGTADGVSPKPKGNAQSGGAAAAGTAAGIGGGYLAQGITEAFDDLTGVRAQARIDSTNANNPRPEIDVQISNDVSVKVSHVIGTPPPSEPDTNYVTLDWRVGRNWSIETSIGDQNSTTLDAVWQLRY